jgi:hypothetical protein
MPVAIGAYSNTTDTVHKIALRAEFLRKFGAFLAPNIDRPPPHRGCGALSRAETYERLCSLSGTCESLGNRYPMHEF